MGKLDMSIDDYKFLNPPIREAVAQIIFELKQGETVDFKAIQDELRVLFPKETKATRLTFDFDLEKREINGQQNEFTQLSSDDDKMLLRIDQNVLSFHKLSPYKGWEEFSTTFYKVVDSYLRHVKPLRITQTSMRYINQMDIDDADYTDQKYFNVHVSSSIGSDSFSKAISLQSGQPTSETQTKIQFAENLKEGAGSARLILLDIDHIDRRQFEASSYSIAERFNGLHKHVKTLFFDSITEQTKKLFE